MDTFLKQFVNGLSLGSIYALIALGYTMVYGIVKLINFAHGDVMMVGAYTGYFILRAVGATPFGLSCAFLGAMIVCSLLSLLVERSSSRERMTAGCEVLPIPPTVFPIPPIEFSIPPTEISIPLTE